MVDLIKISKKANQQNIKSDTRLYLVLLIAFIILGAIGITNHEMWRDELEAWLIARNSISVSTLLENIEYTGHPGLWYLCLYVINIFFSHPWAMQLFHLLIAAGFVFIFLWYSPFSKLQKSFFCLGYFPLYEYTIISRSYGFSLILLFAFCTLFPSRYRNYLSLAVILALLTNLNAYSLIISFALALTLVLDGILNLGNNNFYSKRWSIAASSIVYVISLTVSVLQILPPSNAEYKGDLLSIATETNSIQSEYLSNFGFYLRRIITSTASVWRGYIPIPKFQEFHFHNTNILYTFSQLNSDISISSIEVIHLIEVFLSLAILLAGVAIFYRQPIILFLYTTTNFAIIGFIYLVRSAFVRHSGFLFVVFLICLWLSTNYRQTNWLANSDTKIVKWLSKHKQKIFTVLLCIHAVGGIYAYGRDTIDPFSASTATAEYIKQNKYDRLIIVGSDDILVAPIPALLDREIYYPETKQLGSFTVWSDNKQQRDSHTTHQDILEQTNDLINKGNKEILLVLTRELEANSDKITAEALARFEPSITENEVYYLYLATKK